MSSSEEEVEFDGGDVHQVECSAEGEAARFLNGQAPAAAAASSSGHASANNSVVSGSTSAASSSGGSAKNGKKPSKGTKKSKGKKPAKKPKTTSKKPPTKKTSSKSTTSKSTSKAAKPNGKANEPGPSSSLELFTKQYREFERGLIRLEKVDQFGFFWDEVPTDLEETYDNNNDDNPPNYPDHPPFNWEMVRRRRDAGRYILNLQERDESRLQQIAQYLHKEQPPKKKSSDEDEEEEEEEEEQGPCCIPVLHGKGVNWDLFRKDVYGMCDSAVERNPEEVGDGKAGSLLHAVKKIKGVLDQIYDRTGYRHTHDIFMANDRHQFNYALEQNTNTEAAFQGKWRQTPFPERKYEPLTDKNVVCAGLSELDERIASYELRTTLPDSFVGVSYTFKDDKKSEAWMKSVLSEAGGQGQEAAAMALAQDEGVIRAQVSTCMEMMLVAVQDRVMTEAGVLNQPELRSANWESETVNNAQQQPQQQSATSSDSTPEIVEQPVWGIDCYTRRNVMICLETEFDEETSLIFIEKWLLPAINACPVDLAHDIANAALILEGLPFKARSNLYYEGAQDNDESIAATEERWSHSLIGKSLKSKIATTGPPWLKLAARLLRRARESMGADFFRIHPKGNGSIVLCQEIPPNTLVTQYRGEVYPSWRWGEKMDAIDITQERKQLKPALPDFYNMALERPQKDPRKYGLLFVDASRKAGHGSSVSHSCAPTCEVRVVAYGGRLCLAMTTLRRVEMGEELTFDYNAVTESLVEYRQAVCLCGYSKCRGSFLHFATADCYQEVLKRNAPIAVRFANLAKGCMKEVMSEEDERTLSNHGFNTAAFGAVSVNRHKAMQENDYLDSMHNVPVWLRTYVAETLRYIEYERRALPISLICEDLAKNSGGTSKGNASGTSKSKGKAEESSSEEDDKPVKGSKPMPTFFFYSKANDSRFRAILKEEEGLEPKDLPGLELTRAIKRIAGTQWKQLSAEEKAKWKKKAEKAWEKQGGRKKAEQERKRKLGEKSESKSKKRKTGESLEEKLETSNLSFKDADAEGFSAMEQRIQQLTQALSRVGRVLDRHREAFNPGGREVSSETLRHQVHAPLTIATDEQIVAWMWNDDDGIVRTLLRKIDKEDCVSPTLKAEFAEITRKHAELESYGTPSSPLDPVIYAVKPKKARRKVRIALLEFRRAIMKDLKAMAKDLKKEKNREKAERKKKLEEERQAKLTASKAKDEGAEFETDPTAGQPDNHHGHMSNGAPDFESSSVATPSLLTDPEMTDPVPARDEDANVEVTSAMHEIVDSVAIGAGNDAKKAKLEEEQRPKPWLKHYNQRFKLQAAADLLLMYARTSTFFLLQPYRPLKSTPVEVYARELGNAVPRSVIDRAVSNKMMDGLESLTSNNIDLEFGTTPIDDASLHTPKGKGTRKKAVTSYVVNSSSFDLCEPDDVVAEVTVDYQGDFVLSQLLQWYNGGIGQSPGLPNDTLGCIRLPSMSGLWEKTETHDARAKIDRPTTYESKTRKSLISWFSNPHQRGSSWPDNITGAFSVNGSEDLPKDTSMKWIPLGSPVLDLLVTGDDTNIMAILAEFGADESKKTADGLLSTLDEGRPAQAVSNWVQCENCNKWRRIPWHVDIDVLAKKFVCSDNKWNKASRSCDAPEDDYEENDNEVVAGEGILAEVGVAVEGINSAAIKKPAQAKKTAVEGIDPVARQKPAQAKNDKCKTEDKKRVRIDDDSEPEWEEEPAPACEPTTADSASHLLSLKKLLHSERADDDDSPKEKRLKKKKKKRKTEVLFETSAGQSTEEEQRPQQLAREAPVEEPASKALPASAPDDFQTAISGLASLRIPKKRKESSPTPGKLCEAVQIPRKTKAPPDTVPSPPKGYEALPRKAPRETQSSSLLANASREGMPSYRKQAPHFASAQNRKSYEAAPREQARKSSSLPSPQKSNPYEGLPAPRRQDSSQWSSSSSLSSPVKSNPYDGLPAPRKQDSSVWSSPRKHSGREAFNKVNEKSDRSSSPYRSYSPQRNKSERGGSPPKPHGSGAPPPQKSNDDVATDTERAKEPDDLNESKDDGVSITQEEPEKKASPAKMLKLPKRRGYGNVQTSIPKTQKEQKELLERQKREQEELARRQAEEELERMRQPQLVSAFSAMDNIQALQQMQLRAAITHEIQRQQLQRINLVQNAIANQLLAAAISSGASQAPSQSVPRDTESHSHHRSRSDRDSYSDRRDHRYDSRYRDDYRDSHHRSRSDRDSYSDRRDHRYDSRYRDDYRDSRDYSYRD